MLVVTETYCNSTWEQKGFCTGWSIRGGSKKGKLNEEIWSTPSGAFGLVLGGVRGLCFCAGLWRTAVSCR